MEVPAERVIDLSAIEGDPTYRADEGLLWFDAEVHPLKGRFRVEVVAPVGSQPGAAITATILLGTGAFLAGCGLAAGYFWRFPTAASAVVTILLFLSPVITYIGLRGRRQQRSDLSLLLMPQDPAADRIRGRLLPLPVRAAGQGNPRSATCRSRNGASPGRACRATTLTDVTLTWRSTDVREPPPRGG